MPAVCRAYSAVQLWFCLRSGNRPVRILCVQEHRGYLVGQNVFPAIIILRYAPRYIRGSDLTDVFVITSSTARIWYCYYFFPCIFFESCFFMGLPRKPRGGCVTTTTTTVINRHRHQKWCWWWQWGQVSISVCEGYVGSVNSPSCSCSSLLCERRLGWNGIPV